VGRGERRDRDDLVVRRCCDPRVRRAPSLASSVGRGSCFRRAINGRSHRPQAPTRPCAAAALVSDRMHHSPFQVRLSGNVSTSWLRTRTWMVACPRTGRPCWTPLTTLAQASAAKAPQRPSSRLASEASMGRVRLERCCACCAGAGTSRPCPRPMAGPRFAGSSPLQASPSRPAAYGLRRHVRACARQFEKWVAQRHAPVLSRGLRMQRC
jgi:hypothetical protein